MALTVSQVDAAITAITAGAQEYTIGDRTYKRGDMETLRKLRKDAQALEDGAANRIFQRVRFGRVGI